MRAPPDRLLSEGPIGPSFFATAGQRQSVVMIYWKELYESPRRLTSKWGHHRIFAPESYELVRTLQLVPIVHAEALHLAAYFPVVWRIHNDRTDLCVLRSLLADGLGHPVKALYASGGLPLALRGFPVIATGPASGGEEVWIDEVVADRPTDVGAPILMEDGRLSRGAVQRIQAVLKVRQAIDMTHRLTESLARHRLLEPWPLDFELAPGGRRVRFDDLMVVRPLASPDADLIEHLRESGIEAATFIAAHRISLFRISILLQAARAAATKETVSPQLEEAT